MSSAPARDAISLLGSWALRDTSVRVRRGRFGLCCREILQGGGASPSAMRLPFHAQPRCLQATHLSRKIPSSLPPSWQQTLLSSALAAAIALAPAAAPARSIDLGTPLSALQAQERTVEDLFERATPSVAYITTFVERTDRLTMNAVEVPAGTGSGFLWDKSGHVVTKCELPASLLPCSPSQLSRACLSHHLFAAST